MSGQRARFSIGTLPADPVDEFLEIAEAADRLGYETLFVADHALKKSPYALLSLAADRTEDITLGPGVTNPYSRNPVVTATAIATVDEISDGRAILGIGAGGHGIEPFGYPQTDPIGAMDGAVRVTRGLLEGEEVTEVREEYEVHEAELEYPAPGTVPVYVAGRGPQLLSFAGAVADGAIAGAGLTSPAGMEYALERIEKGADSAGRNVDDIDVMCWTFLSIAEDRAAAREAISPFVATLVQDAVPRESLESLGITAAEIDRIEDIDDVDALSGAELREIVSDDLVELFAIAGTPDRCVSHIESLVDAGVSHVGMIPFENDENGAVDTLEMFADRVKDRFEDE